MEIVKKQRYFHLAVILIVVLMDLFADFFYGGTEGFLNNFQMPLNFNRIIIYTATFAVYFLNFYLLCPYTLKKKSYFKYFLGIIILIIIFGQIRYLLEEVILFHFTGKHNYFEESRKFIFYTFDNSYFAIKGILYSTLMYIFYDSAENQKRVYQLELDFKKAELNFLKSQLEPHFLFNTLNTFYTDLIDSQPETAKDIHRLCELLRYVTYEAEKELMPLKKEIKFIEDYIYLHRKRFEDTMFLDYNIEGAVNEQVVPSLVLIHFVENIFKHGIISDKENPAKIDLKVTDKEVIVSTENLISTSEKYNHNGIGKENLRRRLFAIYQENFTFESEEKEGLFTTLLKLPISNQL
ncbi:sensor histidine kinase [Frigoriflavimonas asaccharolytica]|uniref:Sensor histidine kinase YesM n=1 Tax=Frigoriflavimonas asaccharolytica TaxID=2735899 RepID=A0A8J8KC20_9FLAO|nr:histidine kinase [Frigoriflavimonas asaccharolytica]NRS93154.1 sensor histidine kinase YesM [Frigoriflavimonas asaccharolytica]